eukprot:TRINITY_DN648_c0_g1_i1.p1 TRINITY_DN648_c0_g1~~TRINITY_DN648_c0_g1_i1.p1  ORF type:complete len:130 (-),score=38.28 TRINITY_DN648_c0_g1_i1:104-442(-)
MAQRRSILGLALLALVAFFGSTAFVSAPHRLPKSEAIAAGGLFSLAASAPVYADALPYGSNGAAYDTTPPDEDSSGYLIFFSALTILSAAKAVFDTGGNKYNLGAAFSDKKK